MLWVKRAAAGLIAFGALALSGCGYTPLYSADATNNVSEALAQVEIAPIGQGFVGLDVRTALLDHMSPNGEPARPVQRLEINLVPALGGLLVQPDSAITRYNYTLTANYKLIDVATGKVLNQGGATGTSGYNVVTSEYATVIARRDAERRAARSVGEKIVTQLSLFMRNKKP